MIEGAGNPGERAVPQSARGRPGRRRFLRRAGDGLAVAAALALPRGPARAAVLNFKCAHNIPATHPTHRRLQEAADTLRHDSDGQIAIDLFPESQLGGETDLLGQLRAGAIDFLPLSGLTLQTLVPVAGINGLAFVFDDKRQVWAAMDGAAGDQVRRGVEAAGLQAFERMFDNGFRHVTTATRPIREAGDFRGLKIRVPVSPLWTSMFKALGAVPTSVSFAELYMALRSRLVDAQENPLLVIEIARLHEVQRHCSLTRHLWDGHWLLANGARWRRLPADVRTLITRAMTDAALRQRGDVIRLADGVEARLRATGLVFNTPTADSFRRALQGAGFYADWRRHFGPDAMAALERYCGPIG